MSIASAMAAEEANDKKREWTARLEAILNANIPSDDKLLLLRAIVEAMKAFAFSE